MAILSINFDVFNLWYFTSFMNWINSLAKKKNHNASRKHHVYEEQEVNTSWRAKRETVAQYSMEYNNNLLSRRLVQLA